jgi:hypothetical protein
MHERWFTDSWTQLMGGTDELLREIRHNAAAVNNEQIGQLLVQAERQRDTLHATLGDFGAQRHELLRLLDDIQRELAVAGRPVTGEIS